MPGVPSLAAIRLRSPLQDQVEIERASLALMLAYLESMIIHLENIRNFIYTPNIYIYTEGKCDLERIIIRDNILKKYNELNISL